MNPTSGGPLQKAVEILQNNNSGVICLAENPTVDAVAAATSLYLGLTKLGKNVSLVCATPIQSDLIASDKIQSAIATSGDNLVITFPFEDGSIDKVDYYISGNTFNIVVKPGTEHQKLGPNNVKFSYTGGAVDFIITVDVENLRRLGEIYNENQDMFKGRKIINIDRHLTNSFFGSANIINKIASSTSELALSILKALNCPLDKEMATNLYSGLVAATKNFSSYSVTPETFEHAASLLKQGAVKKRAPGAPQESPRSMNQVERHVFSRNRPIEEVEKEVMDQEGMDEDNQEELKPKIFGPSSSGDVSSR